MPFSLLAVPLLAALAVPLTARATGRLIRVLHARQVIDTPNARSSHDQPTPRGGGLALLAVALPLMAGLFALLGPFEAGAFEAGAFGAGPYGLLALAVGLMGVSFADDVRPLGAGPRLLVQAAAVGLGLLCLPAGVLTLGGLVPAVVGAPLAALGWVWFINLYNFMDGIDGLAGVETASLGVGVAFAGVLAGGAAVGWTAPGLILAGAAAGFLRWNWHPARVFLGDAGSVPLGFVLGGLLLVLVAQGHLLAALILPATHVADATWTLCRRLIQGHRPWQAHREHFYQRAVQGGWSHDRVARAFAGVNLALMGLAAGAVAWPGLAPGALVLAAGSVIALLIRLARVGRGDGGPRA
ncbi:MraY family glycosyltransferase [Pararhodospirillum oryzae]|uniref:MraY family glycosyltransferase n=1 Tax=Pararhodospirillum oryzae TaxID=478448 RepID=UPI001FEC2C63|nr:glycosyltransferase family 4 protein [Pararhodospirillum oryzae]